MDRLRELSHTADVGFEATASTPEELLEVAALGLVQALGLEAGPGAEEEGIDADGEEMELIRPDAERLLVHWLRELLAGAMAGRGVPDARVEEARLAGEGPARLRAVVRWLPASGSGPVREIKGVTYHGLVAERSEDGDWHARVVLDV